MIKRLDVYQGDQVTTLQPKTAARPLWMVKHDNPVRDIVIRRGVALPEVHPMFPNGHFPLNEQWQRLWKDINPDLPPLKWRALLGYTVAFTNDQGFDKPGDPRRDYINGQGLTAVDDRGNPALPKMELLLCGGATITGRSEGTWFYVKTLDGWADPPPAEWVIAHPEYWFRAVSVNPQGEINNLPQGGNDLVKRVPIVSRYPVRIEMSKLVQL